MEADFDIGCIIKDKLVPQAVKWFTGEAAEYEGDDFGMDDGMFPFFYCKHYQCVY